MKVFSRGTQPNQLFAKAEGTDDAVTTITIAANANHFWALDHVAFSGSVNPDVDVTLTITFGSTEVFKHFIMTGGVGLALLGGMTAGNKNEAVTIESSAAGSGKKINLSVAYR